MAIHLARTGNIRTPDEAWCNAQRRYIGAAVATFNRISSAGINFSHLVSAMRPRTRHLSLFSAAKALFQGYFGVRPLREDDASMLVCWESWNRAAYFVCNESGLLLASQYDREMDALPPRGIEQELVLTRTNGTPCGLLKLRPDAKIKELTWACLYMREGKSYAESGVRRALSAMLSETVKSHGFKRILVPATNAEPELATCLQALGFKPLCVQRQALYLHGAYQDIRIYCIEM